MLSRKMKFKYCTGSAESLRKDGFGQIDRFVYDCLPVIPGQQIYFGGNLWDSFHHHIFYNSLTGAGQF